MAENAVQMVQRIPSPRGDKNGADINLALDALEMAFTHTHVNAFAIVSGDSDFIPLVNKLKEYGKTVFVVGGKAFTSTILQQNCHEFISFESLLSDLPASVVLARRDRAGASAHGSDGAVIGLNERTGQIAVRIAAANVASGPRRSNSTQAMPLVERALQVLERRGVQPQLGLLKSTMLQLDSAFNERAYGAASFSDFVEKLKRDDLVNVTGTGGRYVIERKGSSQPDQRKSQTRGSAAGTSRCSSKTIVWTSKTASRCEDLAAWFKEEHPESRYHVLRIPAVHRVPQLRAGQDVVRMEPNEEQGVMMVYLGAEFYPPAEPPAPEPQAAPEIEEEEDEPQPYVEGQPTIFEPNPPPPPPKPVKKARAPRTTKKAASDSAAPRRTRRKKTD